MLFLPVSEASCASCRETPKQPNECPTSSDLPCSDECKVKQDESENPSSMVKPPLPPPVLEPARKEGRSLKRVPSERFQKMRRKVQRLMSRRSSDVTDIAPVVNSIDETTFLQSIRIPDPGLARSDRFVFVCLVEFVTTNKNFVLTQTVVFS